MAAKVWVGMMKVKTVEKLMNEEMNGRGKWRAGPLDENRLMDGCNTAERQRRDYEILELVLWPNQASWKIISISNMMHRVHITTSRRDTECCLFGPCSETLSSVCLKLEKGSGRRIHSFHTQFLLILQPNQHFYSTVSPYCQATSLLDAPNSPDPQRIILMIWWHIRAPRLHSQYATVKGN